MNSGAAPGRIEIVADENALAQAVAAYFVDCARAAIARHGRFDVALAGGSTPKAAYALLAAPPLRAEVDWTHVRFFFGDERCVAPEDDQSNYKMASETLFAPLDIAAASVYRMRGEDEPAAAARAYAEVLRRELGADDATPAFDLVMLGMGPDGHTASLFPGSDPFEDDASLVRAPYVAKFSTHRITLTPRVLSAAHDVAIATAGSAKAAALAAVLDGPRDVRTYPIQAIAPQGGTLTWFVDRSAAGQLQRAPA